MTLKLAVENRRNDFQWDKSAYFISKLINLVYALRKYWEWHDRQEIPQWELSSILMKRTFTKSSWVLMICLDRNSWHSVNWYCYWIKQPEEEMSRTKCSFTFICARMEYGLYVHFMTFVIRWIVITTHFKIPFAIPFMHFGWHSQPK